MKNSILYTLIGALCCCAAAARAQNATWTGAPYKAKVQAGNAQSSLASTKAKKTPTTVVYPKGSKTPIDNAAVTRMGLMAE